MGSSAAGVSAATNEELGRQTALTLMGEMRFLGKLINIDSDNELIDPPTRDSLKFQQIGGVDAAKSGPANLAANVVGLRYCVADGAVERTELFDIDHADPFAHIRERQEALLAHLNNTDNTDFKKGFLSAKGISEYFGNVPPDGKIKGARRFYRLCYNDIDNLLLLCHACNAKKGAKDSLEWFGEQKPFLGQEFVEAVTEAGGFHDGIIIKKVMKKGEDTRLVKIGGVDCTLHAGDENVFGMGQFVNRWFEDANPGYSKDITAAYKNIWLLFKTIAQKRLSQKGEAAGQTKRESGKLSSTLEQCIQAVDAHYKITSREALGGSSSSEGGSQSSSDDDDSRELRLSDIDRQVKAVFERMHGIKKFYKEMSRGHRLEGITKGDVFDFLESSQLYNLGSAQQKAALQDMQDKVMSIQPETPITAAIAKEVIRVAVYNHSPEKLEDERRAAEDDRQRAEARAEAESQARIDAQRQLAEIQRQLAEAQHQLAENQRRTELTRTSEHLGGVDSEAKKTKTGEGDVSSVRSRSLSPSGRRR